MTDREIASACRWLDERGARFYYDGPPKDRARFVPALLEHARSLGWQPPAPLEVSGPIRNDGYQDP